MAGKQGVETVILHLGSGIAALGERDEAKLAERLPRDITYVGVGVGKRWSRSFMKLAASRTGGHFSQINPDEKVSWRAFELLATLNSPRLLDVKVNDERERLTFLNLADSLAQGEELCAVTRLRDDEPLPKTLTIAGRLSTQQQSATGGLPASATGTGGQATRGTRPAAVDSLPADSLFQRTVAVEDVVENVGHLPRTWARLEIDRLLADGADQRKADILALSKAMYVMSPFTSLLVLESDEMYAQFKVDRGRKDHWAMYPAPAKIVVVHEPFPAPPTTPAVTSRQAEAEALRQALAQRLWTIAGFAPNVRRPGQLNVNVNGIVNWLDFDGITPWPTLGGNNQTHRLNLWVRPSAADAGLPFTNYHWSNLNQPGSTWGDGELWGTRVYSVGDLVTDSRSRGRWGIDPMDRYNAAPLLLGYRAPMAEQEILATLNEGFNRDLPGLWTTTGDRFEWDYITLESKQRQLARRSGTGGGAAADFQPLIDLIQATVLPDSWETEFDDVLPFEWSIDFDGDEVLSELADDIRINDPLSQIPSLGVESLSRGDKFLAVLQQLEMSGIPFPDELPIIYPTR